MARSYDYEVEDESGSEGFEMLEPEGFQSPRPGPSTARASFNSHMNGEGLSLPVIAQRQRIEAEIAKFDDEIKYFDMEIKRFSEAKKAVIEKKNTMSKELERVLDVAYGRSNGKGKEKATGLNYFEGEFPWGPSLQCYMKKTFGISSFRFCQEAVCNANLDGRDIVCVMPTGGGKSLTYQLPALITPGVTLVISPLLSLISDQIMHLREAGVEAAKLTGATSKVEAEDINRRLQLQARSQKEDSTKEIKLVYVTPEKVVQSKRFQNLLQKLADGGQLARIVLDEAHCVSQLGHDFRPDYAKLRILRQLFPRVPILSLSATCPPHVLQDLTKILGLATVVDGKSAPAKGTVYFSAPLYRKNLHYSIVLKHHESNRVMDDMVEWIKEHRSNDSGIVYCLSKKDAEKVAEELQQRGGIRTGVYHADRTDSQKEHLHEQWRKGVVKVVCATIAFGLGIDKGDVRFVLHHSISKSLDGFYQESGRAGRDGKDSDCVLFYRPQDASTLSSMTYSDKEGTSKLHGMLSFAQDLRTCRKLQFAKYFSHSSQLNMNSWSTDEESAHVDCGHCDNCTRPPDETEERDVTFQTWQILKILKTILGSGGTVTATMLAGLARGTGGGAFNVSGGGRGKRKSSSSKGSLDLEEVCGGKVDMKRDDIEFLVVALVLEQYLDEYPQVGPYTTTMYMKAGRLAPRIDSRGRTDIESGAGARVKVWFKKMKKASKAKDKDKPPKGRRTSSGTGKRGRSSKSAAKTNENDGNGEEYEVDLDSDIDEQVNDECDQTTLVASSNPHHSPDEGDGDDAADGDGYNWEPDYRGPHQRKRLKQDTAPPSRSTASGSRGSAPVKQNAAASKGNGLGVIEISDSE